MKVVAAMAFAVLVSVVAGVYAQDALPGRYTGTYAFLGGSKENTVRLTLVIASVEGGIVKGTATNEGSTGRKNPCGGDYPMEGKYEGNKLQLKSTEKGGRVGDCGLSLNLTVEGNKLVGTTGAGYKVQLSK